MSNGTSFVAGDDISVNTATSNWAKLMERLGPILMNTGRQHQGGPMLPPVVGTPAYPTPPPRIGMPPQESFNIKTDPRASASLPAPAAERSLMPPFQTTPGAELFQSSLNPRNQAAFQAIQGVSQAVHTFMQKRDVDQHAEARNAAQNLMQAIQSGDQNQINAVLRNHEKLFNKVYKGWLQETGESQKQKQKPQKKKDPDVAGFEAGVAAYQAGQPRQIPRTIQGPSGRQYFIPQATPEQFAKQQQASSIAQALRQQPSLGIPGGVMTPEEQLKYQTAVVQYQRDLQKQGADYQKAQLEVQKAQSEAQRAEQDALTAKSRGETVESINRANLTKANTQLDIEKARLENIRAQLLNIKVRGALTQRLSQSDKIKISALDQVANIFNSIDAQKGKFTDGDIQNLQQQLRLAGASTLSGSLSKYLSSGSLMKWYYKPDLTDLKQNVASYLDTLKTLTESQSGATNGLEAPDPTDVRSDDDPLGYFSESPK
jgi:hypothetical protein